MKTIFEYVVKLDKRKRCIIKGLNGIRKYHATVYANGKIILDPMILVGVNEFLEFIKPKIRVVDGKANRKKFQPQISRITIVRNTDDITNYEDQTKMHS